MPGKLKVVRLISYFLPLLLLQDKQKFKCGGAITCEKYIILTLYLCINYSKFVLNMIIVTPIHNKITGTNLHRKFKVNINIYK